MSLRSNWRNLLRLPVILLALAPAAPAPAFLFWQQPQIRGDAVTGNEPGVVIPLDGATPAEQRANLLWAMRAGLNVAALQCQFDPGLLTVRYYNEVIRFHAAELQGAYNALSAYFKRTGGKTWQTKLDEYTTRTYNGFSTFHAQYGFCETAASIDREAMSRPRGQLAQTAATRMREFRNSLVPVPGDMAFAFHSERVPRDMVPPIPYCLDRKDRMIDCTTKKRL